MPNGTILTKQQEDYSLFIYQGMSQHDAYKASHDCKALSLKSIDSNASRLANTSKIKARVEALRTPKRKEIRGTVEKREEILSDIFEDEKVYPTHRMTAIDIRNKMDGIYKQEVSLPVDELSEAFVFSLFSRMQANRKQLQEGTDVQRQGEAEGSEPGGDAETQTGYDTEG